MKHGTELEFSDLFKKKKTQKKKTNEMNLVIVVFTTVQFLFKYTYLRTSYACFTIITYVHTYGNMLNMVYLV